MNKTHGALTTALSNNSLILSSLSPETPATNSGAATLSNGTDNSCKQFIYIIVMQDLVVHSRNEIRHHKAKFRGDVWHVSCPLLKQVPPLLKVLTKRAR